MLKRTTRRSAARTFAAMAAGLGLLLAGCGGTSEPAAEPEREPATPTADNAPAPAPAPDNAAQEADMLRVVLERTADAPEGQAEATPRETTILLDLPAGWREAASFEGGWTQPEGAPTLMLVAAGYDDQKRSGEYHAIQNGQTVLINLHPTWADNNVTLTLEPAPDGGDLRGEWGHSTFVGYSEKGRARADAGED